MWRLGESGFEAEFHTADARAKPQAKPLASILALSMPAMKKIATAPGSRRFIDNHAHYIH
jgi:hypothetical protein